MGSRPRAGTPPVVSRFRRLRCRFRPQTGGDAPHCRSVAYLLALVGAALAVVAFPPFGAWPLVIVGPAVWLWGLRRLETPLVGAAAGLLFGLAFFGGLVWWLSELGIEAVVPVVIVQALYPALFGWLVVRLGRHVTDATWWVLASGVWALVEFLRYRLPVGGLEWGAWGYALSSVEWAREAAGWMGTSGWTVVVMAGAAGVASVRRGGEWLAVGAPLALACLALAVGANSADLPAGIPVEVAIVQGSTPCPFEHCANERHLTYLQHLALTQTIPAGRVDLVVWSEGSTGSTTADPVNNPDVGEAIGAEASRLRAWMLVGGDRPLNETHWLNANVVFDPSGAIVGEYRKRHPVPFGEYIPNRPWFEWIPALDQVPRDMTPGDGPVVFDLPGYGLGSVISFEGGFARYARQTAAIGAGLLVVATNEGSYGTTPASDQFIGMTRMRSAETGLDLVHAAVTGKSAVVTDGGILGETTGLGTMEVLFGTVHARPGLTTFYVRWGEWLTVVMGLAAVGVLVVSRPQGTS